LLHLRRGWAVRGEGGVGGGRGSVTVSKEVSVAAECKPTRWNQTVGSDKSLTQKVAISTPGGWGVEAGDEWAV